MKKTVDSKKKSLPRQLGQMSEEFLFTKVMLWAATYEACRVYKVKGKLPYIYLVQDAPRLCEVYNELSLEGESAREQQDDLCAVFSRYANTDCAIFSAEDNQWLRLARRDMKGIHDAVISSYIDLLGDILCGMDEDVPEDALLAELLQMDGSD